MRSPVKKPAIHPKKKPEPKEKKSEKESKIKVLCPCGSGKPKIECCDLKNPKAADLDKNGKISKYEMAKAQAIEKNMAAENINTPEGENALYESRFTRRNTRLFEKLLKEWTK